MCDLGVGLKGKEISVVSLFYICFDNKNRSTVVMKGFLAVRRKVFRDEIHYVKLIDMTEDTVMECMKYGMSYC